MTDLTFTLLRLGFLILLWVFVLSVIGVMRRDLRDPHSRSDRAGGRGSGAAERAVAAPAVVPAAASLPHASAEAAAALPRRRAPHGPSRLVVTSGPLQGTTLPLTTSAILIGRAPSCTLVLDDGYSSSRHARIFPQNGTWYVEDLGSTNGTFVGEQRIEGIVALDGGASVRIGQSVVELQR